MHAKASCGAERYGMHGSHWEQPPWAAYGTWETTLYPDPTAVQNLPWAGIFDRIDSCPIFLQFEIVISIHCGTKMRLLIEPWMAIPLFKSTFVSSWQMLVIVMMELITQSGSRMKQNWTWSCYLWKHPTNTSDRNDRPLFYIITKIQIHLDHGQEYVMIHSIYLYESEQSKAKASTHVAHNPSCIDLTETRCFDHF